MLGPTGYIQYIIRVRLYVSDEIQQLDLRYILYFIDGSSKRCPAM